MLKIDFVISDFVDMLSYLWKDEEETQDDKCKKIKIKFHGVSVRDLDQSLHEDQPFDP